MPILDTALNDLFHRISQAAHVQLDISPIPLTIKLNTMTCEAWYAFFGRGAIRLEKSGSDIVGIAVWNTPGSLNKPDFHLDTTKIDIIAEVDTIVKMIHGQGGALLRTSLFEDTSSDISTFMGSIGTMAYNKKVTTLYQSYIPWASVNNKKAVQPEYFSDLARQWLISHGKGPYVDIKVEKGTVSTTVVNTSQESAFDRHIVNNDIYYKAKVMDRSLRNLAQNDPLINGIFICGAPGDDKLEFVTKVLKSERVWDSKVVYKTGITGFASLLQTLWENRKDKILIIDQSDRLYLSTENKMASITKKLLTTALSTEDRYRVISYVRETSKKDSKDE